MKTIWMGAAVMLGVVLSFAGCSKPDAAEEFPYLVMGTDAQHPPFTMREAAGALVVGFDVEVAKAITGTAGLPLKVEELKGDRLLPALANGKLDVVVSALAITEERQRLVDFSVPYYDATPVVMMVAGGIVPAAKEELRDLRIGVQTGGKGEALAAGLAPAERVFRFAAAGEAVQKMLAGEVDGVILDADQAKHLAKKHELLMVLGLEFEPEVYGVAVKKGNGELLAKVNQALAEIAADGRRDQFLEQWVAPSADLPE